MVVDPRGGDRCSWVWLPGRLLLVVLVVAVVSLPSVAAADDASGDGVLWQSPACEEDGSPLLSSPMCTPPASYRPSVLPTPLTCEGAVLCDVTDEELAAAGLDLGLMAREEAEATAWSLPGVELDGWGFERGAVSVAGSRGYLATYSAWLEFHLYYNAHCEDTVKQNHRCGWLYHRYTCSGYCPLAAYDTVFTSSYPARSGNNHPPDDWTPNVGPVPDEITWRWGT